MTNARQKNTLNRYTDLTALAGILSTSSITFLSPESWEDRNDAYNLAAYKMRKELATVLALCFSQGVETFYHWKAFAPGPSGVCIE